MKMIMRDMRVGDFLLIMQANKEMYPEFDALSDKEKVAIANDHIERGVADTYLSDKGEVLGVGGIEFLQVGQGWFVTLPEKRTPALLRTVKEQFERIVETKNLVTVYATSRIAETFLKHLLFTKESVHIFRRRPNGRER